MLAAIPQPLEVHQVGGPTFVQGLIGPALIAFAAIVAAFLAAYVARRNQGQQLANDRALRDVEHARRSISSAVETIQEAIHALTTLDTSTVRATETKVIREAAEDNTDQFEWLERDDNGNIHDPRDVPELEAAPVYLAREENESIQAETAALREELDAIRIAGENRTEVDANFSRLLSDTLRLRIAMGDGSAVVPRHAELVEALRAWADLLRPDAGTGGYQVALDGEERVALMSDALQNFVAACQRWSAER